MARKSRTLTLVTSSAATPTPQDTHAPTPGLLATMALLGGFDKEPPPPPASPDVRQIALRDISPSAYQPRRFRVPDAEDADLFRLAASIRRGGVLQPILLRPHAADGGFELVAGERRYRASCLQSPELDALGPAPFYIPALVRELTDQEAHAIAVTENLLRKDLHPLEEAEGVASLLLLMREDAEAVARSIGQTRSWVACRARIHTHLLDDIKDLFASNTSLRGWTVGHLEEVAKLAPEIQREVLAAVQHGGYYGDLTVTRLRKWLSGFTMKLSDAPFPLEDDTLHPAAGACTTCPFHTLAAPHLFEEEGEDPQGDLRKARCLNGRCWETKRQSFLDRRRDELRASHPDLRLVATSFEDLPIEWRRDGVLRPTDYTKMKKRARGAVPAMVAAGPRGGELMWIKVAQVERRTPASATDSSGSSEADAQADRLVAGRERLRRRRLARIAVLATEMLEAHDGSAISSDRLMALCLAFGTDRRRGAEWIGHEMTWSAFDELCGSGREEVAANLWKTQLVPLLASRLRLPSVPRAHAHDDLENEVRNVLLLIAGPSFDSVFRQVAGEIPEPKAWKKLPGYVAEQLGDASDVAEPVRSGAADDVTAGAPEAHCAGVPEKETLM